jgi:hypothetical protein
VPPIARWQVAFYFACFYNLSFLQVQRLLGVVAVHCVAHRLNLINGEGLACIPLVSTLNMVVKIVNSDSFGVLMSAAQAARYPDTPIVKVRYVSFHRFSSHSKR